MVTSRRTQKEGYMNSYIPSQERKTAVSISPTPSAITKPVTNQTFDEEYPWLNEKNYRRMESEIDKLRLSAENRKEAMNNWYRNNVTYLLNDQTLDERDIYLNQQAYEAAKIQDPQAYAQLRMSQASQKAKREWNLDATANDLDIFTDIVNSLPNWMQLAWEYLEWKNKDLLYEAWLLDRIEAPEIPETAVWGIQSMINKESEMWTDSTLWKVNAVADWINFPWKVTEFVDSLVQKIPVVTWETQVKNLVNKMNNLSDEEMQNLYARYVNMIRNGSDEKWKNDDRNGYALFWDAITWDKDALDRINTLHLINYDEALGKQDWIQRNKRWNQALENVTGTKDIDAVYENIDNSDMNDVAKGLAKASVWTTDKMKNLVNFAWWLYGTLENYADALGVWLQELKDIKDNRFAPTDWLETNEDAFMEYVADKTANFGEYMLDAPDTVMWKPITPNAVKFISNLPWSFLKTVSAQIRWKTNPLDSKVWMAKLIFTEEWQEALLNRYGTPEALANAINSDPAWVADDMLDLADKLNLAINKATWGNVERQQIGSLMDSLSDTAVSNLWAWMTKVSDWMENNWYKRTSNLINLERDVSMNPSQVMDDTKKIAQQWAEDVVDAAKWTYDEAKEVASDINKKRGEVSEAYKKKSTEVWDKAKNLPTRTIPEKMVENDLKLTPKERERVEKSGITAANFVLKENIAWLKNEDKIVALQDISSDAYNKITDTFKNKIPDNYREKSKVASKMLNTMVNAMESSDIVKEEYGDYINKLKEMAQYDDYSPYEKLAIRRDFDAIVWNDLFKKDGTLKGDIENWIVAWWRADLNDEINEIGKKYGIDVKDENSRISNAITIRDWLIRSVSQWKKNNYLWLQDLWIWAVLSSWNPVNALWIVAAKKFWDAKSWNIAQSMYNMNDNPLKTANAKKWPSFIKKWWNGNRTLMLDSLTDNTSTN